MQQGAFTVHSSGTPLTMIAECGMWLRQFVIPANHVSAIARQLDLLGFRLGDLFPDLGNLARELTGRHPPVSRSKAPGPLGKRAP